MSEVLHGIVAKRNELVIHVFLLALLICIAFFPTLRQASFAPQDTFYPHIHGILQDYYLDLSTIRQGRIQFHEIDQYTTETTSPSRVHLLYLLMGRIAVSTGISDIGIYYTSLFLTLLLFYFFVQKLVKVIVPKKYFWVSLLLIFFASPFPPYEINALGKKIFLGTSWWTYMDPYHRLILRPHHFLAVTLLVASVYLTVRVLKKPKLSSVVMTFFFCAFGIMISVIPILIFISSLSLLTAGALVRSVVQRRSIWDKKIFVGFVSIILLTLPIFDYMRSQVTALGFPWTVISDWEYLTFRGENFPVTFWVYVQSFGILIPFILLSIPKIVKEKKPEHILILLLTVIPLVLYFLSTEGVIHINKLRFVYSAPYVFGGMIAALGLDSLIGAVRSKKLYKLLYAIAVILIGANGLWGLSSYWWIEVTTRSIYSNTYIPQKYMTALQYLDKETPRFSNVLSTFYVGMYLPAFAYNTVYIGHETSTYNFWQKRLLTDSFFAGSMSQEQARNLFHQGKIAYVFWDHENLPDAYKSILDPMYSRDGIIIYKVIN